MAGTVRKLSRVQTKRVELLARPTTTPPRPPLRSLYSTVTSFRRREGQKPGRSCYSSWSSCCISVDMRVLCVAEKPSIAKAITQILSGGQFNTVSDVFALMRCCSVLSFVTVQHRDTVHQELRFRLPTSWVPFHRHFRHRSSLYT